MKISMVTDAWEPQVNGVVWTLKSTMRELRALGHSVEIITPLEFRTRTLAWSIQSMVW